MSPERSLPRHVVSLVDALVRPAAARELTLEQWDLLIRVGRGARLAAAVGARLRAARELAAIPDQPLAHLRADETLADYQTQMVRLELRQVESALAPLAAPIVLLKGAAYLLQDKPWAHGRMLSDVDILVPRERLEEVERALLAAGWASEVSDPYDQRYYRRWSHELPPMIRPGAALELDVHHSILPLTGRLRPDARALLAASTEIEGTRFRALCREDQIVHAAVHLFQDSDCADRLRDLVDLDGLFRELETNDAWEKLAARARRLALGRPLWYAMRYSQVLLATPVPSVAYAALEHDAPKAALRWLMDRLVPPALLPTHPDRAPPASTRFARALLYIRSLWLRMPPWLLVPHLARKAWRRLADTEPADAPRGPLAR